MIHRVRKKKPRRLLAAEQPPHEVAAWLEWLGDRSAKERRVLRGEVWSARLRRFILFSVEVAPLRGSEE